MDKLDTAVASRVTPEQVTELVQDIVGQMLKGGANIAVTYNDATGTFTISTSATPASGIL